MNRPERQRGPSYGEELLDFQGERLRELMPDMPEDEFNQRVKQIHLFITAGTNDRLFMGRLNNASFSVLMKIEEGSYGQDALTQLESLEAQQSDLNPVQYSIHLKALTYLIDPHAFSELRD